MIEEMDSGALLVKGSITYSNGTVFTGTWGDRGNGRWAFVGEGSITDSDGKVQRGTWGDRGNGQWEIILTEEPAAKRQRTE